MEQVSSWSHFRYILTPELQVWQFNRHHVVHQSLQDLLVHNRSSGGNSWISMGL
jgi:hypothetical protein